MRWDYSLGQRAEDRWTEMRIAAEEQRRLRKLWPGRNHRPEGTVRSSGRRTVSGLGSRVRRWVMGIAGFIPLVLVLLVVDAGAQPITEMARNLAENVLGRGVVTAVRLAPDGQTLHLRWTSPTFRPEQAASQARGQIYGEAELATGAVLGKLRGIMTLRFTVFGEGQIVAVGFNTRGEGITIVYASRLGGGSVSPTVPTPAPGDSSTRPLSGGMSARSW